MDVYPTYVKEDTDLETMREDLTNNFVLFDKQINDQVLFITMNYLANPIQIMDYKATNEFCKTAVEKIMLNITTSSRDVFLTSLKLINIEDLKYFDSQDIIGHDLRQLSDQLGSHLRSLLDMTGRGIFMREDGRYDPSISTAADFNTLLRDYGSSEGAT